MGGGAGYHFRKYDKKVEVNLRLLKTDLQLLRNEAL